MAPEVRRGSNYNSSMDSWGLGVIYYHLLTEGYPFGESISEEILREVYTRIDRLEVSNDSK